MVMYTQDLLKRLKGVLLNAMNTDQNIAMGCILFGSLILEKVLRRLTEGQLRVLQILYGTSLTSRGAPLLYQMPASC